MLEKTDFINVKALSESEREQLCEEIRRKIIETVAAAAGAHSDHHGAG